MPARRRRTVVRYEATCGRARGGSPFRVMAAEYCVSRSMSESVSNRAAPSAGISIRSCDVTALPAIDDPYGLSLAPRDGAGRAELDVGGEGERRDQLIPQVAGDSARAVAVRGRA